MAYSMNELKKGLRIEFGGIPYRIIEYHHVKPGKGPAFVRTKVKNLLNSKVVEKTFHAGDKCEKPDLANKKAQFSYEDEDFVHFMDTTNYETISLTIDQVGDAYKWIIDGTVVEMLYFNDQPISLDVPNFMEFEIVDTPPNFKGDTTGSNKKTAELNCKAKVQVPFHILTGDKIKVDTVKGEYLEKVK
jgi:elongation factor P